LGLVGALALTSTIAQGGIAAEKEWFQQSWGTVEKEWLQQSWGSSQFQM